MHTKDRRLIQHKILSKGGFQDLGMDFM